MRIPNRRNLKYHFSPLRYPGGKSFLFTLFDRIIEKNNMSSLTYVEPFAGGAGAALALLLLERVDRIVINDLDRAVYSFWRSILVETERFIDKLLMTHVTVDEWRKQRSIYCDRRSRRFDLGFATFFLNRTNVSGILDGGPIGGVDQHGKWKLDARFYKETLAQRIQSVADYSNRIVVSNRDGIELIGSYMGCDNALIYLDPPYYEKGATLYMNHYADDDHRRLATRLRRNSKAHWILTYDDHSRIRSLYDGYQTSAFPLNYSARDARMGRELLVMSDSLVF